MLLSFAPVSVVNETPVGTGLLVKALFRVPLAVVIGECVHGINYYTN